ncbi:hypothetical protein PACTADRAFT_31508 [Pachysolen tannophilus NRRL Y-2460]|uniref:NEDD8-activating enzyme E1 regulatory subunit n=1 Tax=Pachysolen tannophilus NRRL Y-2460 TaxID=669874 RepID=A0A1E4U276_PACTA|nr:hypothetical protein PACTADRAFT_31508 [Pachysolen tannophilus NRRL Y-2460]
MDSSKEMAYGDNKVNKLDKYDRQLRLWALNGQSSLENAHICLINVTTTNIELLKNLILPGCSNFTIIDDKLLEKDLSTNFFWSEAESNISIVENLKDLNPDANVNLLEESIQNILNKNDIEFWEQFSVVITDDSLIFNDYEQKIVDILWHKNIPFIKNLSYGFYGFTKIVLREHPIIETHPQSLTDLRIDCPWKELKEYIDSINLDEADSTEHAHIPYVIILIKSLEIWKSEHDDKPPVDYKEKQQFKKLIESFSKYPNEPNFAEAVQFSWRASQSTNLPESINELLNDVNDVNLTTPLFWIYVKALKKFLKKTMDMISDTVNYVSLQNIYRKKFEADKRMFIDEVEKLLISIGRSLDEVDNELAAAFCKNSRFILIQKGTKCKLKLDDNIIQQINTVANLKKHDVCLRPYSPEENYTKLFKSLKDIFKNNGVNEENISDTLSSVLKEFSRSGGIELHNIASFMGGIGSQEVLKLVTGQYIPLDNTFVFDGIRSTSENWKI